ncbi:MAG: hypothetical protein M1812_007790 [Candelaria pacifica]|nr:MAG: hypothetical protein M1812_007790 [Candelaria pacifica]
MSKSATDNNNNKMRDLQTLKDRLGQLPADTSSTRTPTLISSQFNIADKIEHQLNVDGHRIWGFVVYRCTYNSNSAWDLCIQRINASIRKAIDLYNGHDLLEENRFKLTVIDDPELLDGASAQTVRRHFNQWCVSTIYEEQGLQDEIERRRKKADPFDSLEPWRYRFCIQIDEASLQSMSISEEREGWVKLIKSDWEPRESTKQLQRQHDETGPEVMTEDEGEFTDDDDDDEKYPAIEGCTQRDVGWMMVQLQNVLDFYDLLRDPNAWHIVYSRPREVATA